MTKGKQYLHMQWIWDQNYASWRSPGGVAEPFLGVCEGSAACVRTSRGVKVTLGKACQRFCDQTGDVLGVLKPPPPPGEDFIFRIPPEKPNSDEPSGKV